MENYSRMILHPNELRNERIHDGDTWWCVSTSKLAFSGARRPCNFLAYVAVRQSEASMVDTLLRGTPAIMQPVPERNCESSVEFYLI